MADLLQVLVTLNEAGEVNLKASGQLGDNEIAILGLLEKGKLALAAPKPAEAARPPLLAPNGRPLPNLRG